MSNQSLTRKIKRAKSLYRRFTGHEIERATRIKFPGNPKIALDIGKVLGIMYETVRDGKLERYLHEFNAASRPLFVVSSDGKQLFMLGGAYDFTERGIVDRKRKRR